MFSPLFKSILKGLYPIKKDLTGFSIAEAVIAGAFFMVIATSIISALVYFNQLSTVTGLKARAIFLSEEGLEAARNLRDNSFVNLVDGPRGLSKSSSQWAFSGSSDTIDGFSRQLTISSLDSDTKKIVSQVSWSNRGNNYTTSLIGRLTNWQKIVSAIGNWSTTTLEASLDLSGTHDGRKVQVVGNYAYIVRSDGTPDFIIIDISDPANPMLAGSLSLAGGATNIFVSGGYAYVSSDDDNGELKIINIAIPASPVLVGTYNASGNGDGNGIYVVGSVAYLVRTNSGSSPGFLAIDISNPASPTLLGSISLGQIVYEVVVSGDYAYLATADNNFELRVIDISNPASPSAVGSLNLPSNTNAITIAFSGNIVFIGQGSTLYTVDISTPALPTLLGSVAIGGTLNDIALNLGNTNTLLFIATSDANNEFKVIDVTTPATPVILGQQNIAGTNVLLGAAYDATLDRAFLVGQLNTQEFVIIAPN